MKLAAHRSTPRTGFTLVELLVAMGLTMFIMVILVEAFTAGLATFQGLRTMGQLQNQARSAVQLLRNDLQQDHFEGSRRLSDSTFWATPRREGFVCVRQGSPAAANNPNYQNEGADLDGANDSYIARDHVLHFSNRLRGNRRENFVFDGTASVGFVTLRTSLLRVLLDATYGVDLVLAESKTYSSQWCEVAYVLVPHKPPQPLTVQDSPIVLHNLYRVNLLVVPYVDAINNTIDYNTANFQLTSQKNNNGKFQFFSPNDLARGRRSFDPAGSMDLNTAAGQSNLRGKALVCTNVVSFQMRILKDGATAYEDIPGGTLDTAVNQNFRVMGLQIVLRIYDPGLGLTRQVTLIQDM